MLLTGAGKCLGSIRKSKSKGLDQKGHLKLFCPEFINTGVLPQDSRFNVLALVANQNLGSAVGQQIVFSKVFGIHSPSRVLCPTAKSFLLLSITV